MGDIFRWLGGRLPGVCVWVGARGLFVRFAARAVRGLLSVYVFSYFAFEFEGRVWDLIVSVPDHCLSFYFDLCVIKDISIWSVI